MGETREVIAKFLQRFAAPVALGSFWGGMTAAAHAYPGGYDWPYQTISVLLYSDQNPHGYVWAWAGLELCGLAGFGWATALDRVLGSTHEGRRAPGLLLLQLGFLCMCCAVLPDRLLPLPKGHELFAILAFLGVCIGMTCQMWVNAASPEARRLGEGSARPRSLLSGITALLPLVPMVFAALTQAYLTLERPDLPWVNPSWRTRGISPLLSFGLWEWISSAALTIALLAIWSHRRNAVDRH